MVSRFYFLGRGLNLSFELLPKLTPQKKFHKPGRRYQDTLIATSRTALLGVVGCTASLLTPRTPEKREFFALLPQTKTPGLRQGLESEESFLQHPLQGYHCLTTPFPCLLASVNVWPSLAVVHQAEMRFWNCHVCSRVLCTGLNYQ